jgi:hypothetical protein
MAPSDPAGGSIVGDKNPKKQPKPKKPKPPRPA